MFAISGQTLTSALLADIKECGLHTGAVGALHQCADSGVMFQFFFCEIAVLSADLIFGPALLGLLADYPRVHAAKTPTLPSPFHCDCMHLTPKRDMQA